MELFSISPEKYQDFLLILVRTSALFISAPFFGFRLVPSSVKILCSVFISLIIAVYLPPSSYVVTTLVEMIVLIAHQILVGAMLGVIASFTFEAIRFAGEIIDLQMGFGMASIMDPSTQIRQTLFGEFNYILAIMVFIVINGHHFLLLNLISTFDKVPLYQLGFTSNIEFSILENFRSLFVIGLKLALPILALLLLVDIISGLISRLIPQLNIFVISFPFKITAGFIALIAFLPEILRIYAHLIRNIYFNLNALF
jgi:flagellar biosynthetic protein FliR